MGLPEKGYWKKKPTPLPIVYRFAFDLDHYLRLNIPGEGEKDLVVVGIQIKHDDAGFIKVYKFSNASQYEERNIIDNLLVEHLGQVNNRYIKNELEKDKRIVEAQGRADDGGDKIF